MKGKQEGDEGAPSVKASDSSATKNGEIRLLSDVSGYVTPGTLLALMGASGAGKVNCREIKLRTNWFIQSTLLDVLAGRKSSGRITGEVLINGKKPDHTFTRYTAYVTQNDILFPTHTVKEAIQFSAMCRLPDTVSPDEKIRFAEQILIDLDLKKIENKVVGMPGTGISPEQRKRLNLGMHLLNHRCSYLPFITAVELASNPQLIFLDEPTTGLDSAAARKVMTLVKKLTMQGRSVMYVPFNLWYCC